jgi:multidrug resistance efflux pump
VRRRVGVGLIALITAASLAGTALWYRYEGQHFVGSAYAFVTAPSAWVTTSQVERVVRVDVATGDHVTRGQPLVEVQTPAGVRMTLTAPFGGDVGPVPASVGSVLAADAPLVAIVDMSRAQVEVELPESETHRVRRGEKVDLTLAAYPGRTLAGRVARLGTATLAALNPSVSFGGFTPETQWVSVWVTLPKVANLVYVAGESASARIHI